MKLDFKSLGKRIKAQRKNKNLTQEELAEKIGVSSVYISHIEIGSAKPSLDILVKICNVLEVTPDYVLANSIYSSKEYLRDDIANLLKECSSENMKLICDIIKVICNR